MINAIIIEPIWTSSMFGDMVILVVCFFIIPSIIGRLSPYFSKEWELTTAGKILVLVPFVSIIYIVMMLFDMGGWLIVYIKKYKEERDKIKLVREYRKLKIKAGIIKITPNDPYGEEDWIEQ